MGSKLVYVDLIFSEDLLNSIKISYSERTPYPIKPSLPLDHQLNPNFNHENPLKSPKPYPPDRNQLLSLLPSTPLDRFSYS